MYQIKLSKMANKREKMSGSIHVDMIDTDDALSMEKE